MSPENPVDINQVSPIGGSLAGGYTVTITGAEFQEGAVAYFGDQLAEKTIVKSDTTIEAVVPGTEQSGIVAVTVVNPDGNQFTLIDGFTYVSMEKTDHAEVFGVSPLTVIEEVETEVTLRGRNIIHAYEKGFLALRGPSRANVTISDVNQSVDTESGIESLTFNVIISASPALGPKERIAIQVLASSRTEARDDLLVESSKQMFTVLPNDIPVPIAYTPSLSSDKPTMVVVLGRNLDGCTLEFGNGIQKHLQKSEEDSVVGLVTVSKDLPENEISNQFSVLDKNGNPIEQYNLTLANSSELKQSDPIPPDAPLPDGAVKLKAEYPDMGFTIDLAAVENQLFLGPTAEDSKLFYLSGEIQNHPGFDFSNFGIEIFSYYIRIPIIRRVYLFPMFDGGGENLGSPILARVGELFPLRGTGILFAARIEITIVITVVVIITIDFPWLTGGFNEFPEQFPGAMMTIITGIIIEIDIIIEISFLTALVLPDGSLFLLFRFNLEIGIDFTISPDGHHLNFIPNFTHSVRFFSILPFAEQFPCNGHFQLADDNGQTVFIDQYGGRQSYYFARSAGQCCVPWRFNLELVRFRSGTSEQIVQSAFDANMCIDAEPSANLMKIIITSVPPPEGVPPTLVMDIEDTALLKALAQPVDGNGNPNGPLQDVRDLGYDVQFYLEFTPELLEPTTLPAGDAFAIQPGENVIRAYITGRRVRNDGPLFTFYPGAVTGFEILRFISTGQPPYVRNDAALPLEVNPAANTVMVESVLAFEDVQNGQPILVAAPLVQNSLAPTTSVWELERYEPFETQREFFLAVRVTIPPTVQSAFELKFTVKDSDMKLLGDTETVVTSGPIIDGTVFGTNRGDKPLPAPQTGVKGEPKEFFTGTLLTPTPSNQPVTVNIPAGANANQLFKVGSLNIISNNKDEDATASPLRKLIPPGKNLAQRKVTPSANPTPTTNDTPPRSVLLRIPLTCKSGTSGIKVSFPKPVFNLAVRNDETLEEYLRVYSQAQSIINDAGNYYKNFAAQLFNQLMTAQQPQIDGILRTNGETLWNTACNDIQTKFDDRPLYWTRLQAIGAIRAFGKPTGANANDVKEYVKKFEYASRGLDANGSVIFDNVPANVRKVIVTGFDPFGLLGNSGTRRSNPSGIIAQYFNKKTLVFTDEGAAHIRTAIIPVRYEDFNDNLIENAITASFGLLSMILSTSQNGDENFYDIERYAASNRVDYTDNNLVTGHHIQPIPIPAGPQYLESTLPYDVVITTSEEITAPVGNAPFVIDQSFKSVGSLGNTLERRDPFAQPRNTPNSNTFHPEPLLNDNDGHVKITDTTLLPTGDSVEGSGSNYLSNEIFYRVALKRFRLNPNTGLPGIPTGHLHVPSTNFSPEIGLGARLITGMTGALRRLIVKSYRFTGSPTPFDFPATIINTTSTPKLLTVFNNSTQPLTIGSMELDAPFSLESTGSDTLPKTVAPGASAKFYYKFSPMSVGQASARLLLHESNSGILYGIDLHGTGIQNQPPPIISSFSPALVFIGEESSVLGQYFTNTTAVKIGNTPVGYNIISDTEILIEAAALSGYVTVTTLFGTVTSSTRLIIRFPPPDR